MDYRTNGMELRRLLSLVILTLPVLGQLVLAVRFFEKADFIGAVISLFTLNVFIIFIYRAIEEKKI